MCRSIKKLRYPDALPTEPEIQEAALQYVRKVSGYRVPSRANQQAFDQAVQEIAASTRVLLGSLRNSGAGMPLPNRRTTIHLAG